MSANNWRYQIAATALVGRMHNYFEYASLYSSL